MIGLIVSFWSVKWALEWHRSTELPKMSPMGKNIFKWLVFITGWIILFINIFSFFEWAITDVEIGKRQKTLEALNPAQTQSASNAAGASVTTLMAFMPTFTPYPDELIKTYIAVMEERYLLCANAREVFYDRVAKNSEKATDEMGFDQVFYDALLKDTDQIELYCINLYQENPPTAWVNFNNNLKRASEANQAFVGDLRRGLQNQDETAIENAILKFNDGGTLMRKAVDEMLSIPVTD